MAMKRVAQLAYGMCAAGLVVGLSAPASATRGPALPGSTVAHPYILVKDKSEKESSAEAKVPPGCKAVARPLGEVRVTRTINCLKPRPILM